MDGIKQLSGCADGNTCPGVWLERGQGTVLVRGQLDADVELPRGDGEVILRLPREFLVAACRTLALEAE